MTDKVIEYKSDEIRVDPDSEDLETSENKGIVSEWVGNFPDEHDKDGFKYNFTWNFDWTKLKNEGVDRLTGRLILKIRRTHPLCNFDIDWTKGKETISEFALLPFLPQYLSYEYRLTPHYNPQFAQMEKVSYDEMFAASEINDTILVVEGKKVHVNKWHLSAHSEFFLALFSSNFKEGQMTEIPIKDVSYEEFGMLLSIISPKHIVFPNDETAKKLLELADRFLMPSVTRQVEHHLLTISKLGNRKKLWLADTYRMEKLLEKTICAMDSVKKAKAIQKSRKFKKLSDGAKAKLFNRLLQLV